MDNCLERVDAADAEAAESIPSKVGMALEAVLALEVVLALGAVVATEAAVLMRRFFWCTRKKIQDKTLFLLYFLPAVLRIFWRTRKKNKQKQEAAG